MIEIKKYKTREEALEKILILDEDYTLIRHDFKKGEIIDTHKHPVDEWVIFNSGKCEITLGIESKIVGAKEYALAIYLPRDEEHGLRCLTDISYWVLRKTK
jgi:quercetin dioxygenase-like cupin family protein